VGKIGSHLAHVSNIYGKAPGNFVIDVGLFMYHEVTFFTSQKVHDIFNKKNIFTTESHLSQIAIVRIANIFCGYTYMRKFEL